MLSLRAVLTSGLMMMAAATGWAAGPGLASGTDAGVDAGNALVRVYALTFHPQAAKTLPAGSVYVCRARVMPGWDAASRLAPGTAGGSRSGCALEIPFLWTANRPQPVATLSYEVDEIDASGRVLRSVAREGVALPESVAGAALHVDVAF